MSKGSSGGNGGTGSGGKGQRGPAGFPSKVPGHKSGGGRDNNPPRR